VACDPIARPGLRALALIFQLHFDVGKRPTWRHLLIRDDPTGEFGPGNARWRIAARYRWRRRRPRVARSTTALPEGKVSGMMTGHNL
jgi:predicted DNA-binding ribbon-helix-helix protein